MRSISYQFWLVRRWSWGSSWDPVI